MVSRTCPTLVLLLLWSVQYSTVETSCSRDLAVATLCSCDDDNGGPFRYRLFCNNGVNPNGTIAAVTDLARSENIAGNFTDLTFIGDPGSVLRSETFNGFIALRTLKITHSKLSYLEPQVFSSLPQLMYLNLNSNSELIWLSIEPFVGLDSLEELVLDYSSKIEHLRENLEPFFSTIDQISLKGLSLRCDCHLEWLYNFTISNDQVKDAQCNGQDLSSLSLNNFTQCSDVCELGYHPCHANATCQISTPDDQPSCSCLPGFVGDGVECQLLNCDCPLDHMVCTISGGPTQCKCEDGFALNSDGGCNRTVSQNVLDLKEECVSADTSDAVEVAECVEELFHTTTSNVSLPGDISTVVSILQSIVDGLSMEGAQPPSINVAQLLVEAASQLLNQSNQDLWQSTDNPSIDIVTIFSIMDELGILLLTHTNITNITTDNIAMVLVRPECEDEHSIPNFNGHNISSDLLDQPPSSSSNLSLPNSLFTDVFANGSVAACSEVGVVSLVYGGVAPTLSLNEDELLASIGCTENTTEQEEEEICSWYGGSGMVCPTEWQVNSVIITATVVNSSEPVSSQLSTPVVITLSHEDTTLSNPVCAFFDETQPLQNNDSWLTENCERNVGASTDTTTVCNCYHLTSFALVMSPSSSPPENQPLHIATKVGLSLSILCLIATVVLLFGLKLENKALHRLHRQLAIALGLAQLVFLVGVDRSSIPSPDWLCTTWAALLHYLLLATFLWQLCEGIHLYLLIGKVFGHHKRMEKFYYLIAWVFPLVIVGPTLGVRFCDYGSENYCWIISDRGTNWAFHAPVIAVLAINLVVLVYVVSVIVRLTRRKDDDACLFLTLIHASLVLVPILGVTWALGFFVVGGGVSATVVEWLFFFFTTLQGVAIFFAHCVLNREVRSSFLKAIGRRDLAQNQQSMATVSRKLSTTTGPSRLLHMRRKSSQFSGSLTIGGFNTSTEASSFRRESEVDNAYLLNELDPISENPESESGSAAPTPQLVSRGQIPE